MTILRLPLILFVMIRLSVFLGNPGSEYRNTRHNAGFLLADELYPDASWQMKFHSSFLSLPDMKVMKPMTFMNLSGTAVSEAKAFFKLTPEEILVAHDDTELPLGTVRLQKGGGLQGHKGLRSIRERIGSDGFYRLRIGIGKPPHGDLALYVTSPFKGDEMIRLSQVFDLCRKLLGSPIKEGEYHIS